MGRAVLSSIVFFVSSIPCLGQVAGNVLHFDGVNDLVRVPDSNSLDLSAAATIEFWCRPDYPVPPSREFQRIINKGDGANGDTDRAYEIAILQPFHAFGPGFDCAFFIGTNTYTATVASHSWQNNTWVHFAAAFSLSAAEVRIYVNGNLEGVSTATADGQPISQPIRNSSYPLNIGAFQAPGIYFEGQLDEVRVWSIARTACDIEENYDRQVDPSTPGLVGYWRFDEAAGVQNVFDSSSAGNHGTLGSSSVTGSDDPARLASTAPVSEVSTDCNLNGASDPCDISSGFSQDCNNNGVPDECDIEPDYLLVASVQDGPILAYRIHGTGLAQPLPSITGGGLSSPTGLTFSSQGELFVANLGGASVSRFAIDAGGEATPNSSLTGNQLNEPTDLAIGPNGELFVANRANGSISRFTFAEDGTPLPQIPLNTGATGSHGIAFSLSGELFYANGDTNILRYQIAPGTGQATPNGSFPIPGHATLRYMEIDSHNELFVPDDFAHTVWRYQIAQGNPIPHGTISVTSALGAAISPSREIFISSSAGGIYRFKLGQTGQPIPNGVIATPGINCVAIRVLSENDCNANGIPDECDADCNKNDVPDDCDVAFPTAESMLRFDGIDDFARVPSDSSLNPGQQVTVEFWVYQYSLGPIESGAWLLTKSQGDCTPFAVGVSPSSTMNFSSHLGPSGDTVIVGGGTAPLFQWLHFAFTLDTGVPIARAYANGVLVAETSQLPDGQPIPSQPLCANSAPVLIGGLPPFPNNYLDGQMDEVRIWNIARTSAEIAANYRRRVEPTTPGLVGYWRYDENAGNQSILDLSPFANHGTLGGTASPAEDDPMRLSSSAPIFEHNPANDCNGNELPDECESIVGPSITTPPASQAVCVGSQAIFMVTAIGDPSPNYQWRKNGIDIEGATSDYHTVVSVGPSDVGVYDVVVSNSCGEVISDAAILAIASSIPASHYTLGTLCPTTAIPNASIIGFTDDGPIAGSCFGQRSFRLFAGQETVATGKLTRVRPGCIVQAFGPTLCTPESVLVDVHGRWQGVCSLPNLLIAGACNTVYFINPANGAICEQFPDPTFDHIGQMAIDSMGRLFVGSVDGDSLNVIDMGAVEAFYSAPGMSPRAVAIDAADNVYVTTAVDGVMSKIGSAGMVIDPTFAAGLSGAISQAIAPQGIFHGNMFVACGDRVMEVDMTTGASSLYLSCRAVHGIAFDPEGYMHISIPSENKVLKIGPSLLGDMNGRGVVTIEDTEGFATALLQLPGAPLPIATADMNADGCADGRDVQLFVTAAKGL